MALEILGEALKIIVLAGLVLAGILVTVIWKKGKATKVTYLRFLVQATAFVAFFYMFTFQIWQLIVLAVILIMPLVLGRVFCGWLCPFGFYMDAITLIRKAAKIRHRDLPEKLNFALHNLRYVLLLVFLMLPLVLLWITPLPSLQFAPVLAEVFAGQFAPWRILMGPVIPLIVPWKGPLEMSGLYFSYPYVQEVIYFANGFFAQGLAWIFVALTFVGSFFVRRVWCRFCPTGSSLAVVNRFNGFKWAPLLHLDKDEEKCTKCGICKRVCSVQVTEVYEQKGGKIDTSMCMLCLRCVEMCPEGECLKVKFGNRTVFSSRNWLEPSQSE
jgi:ferredoxin-type protein NapH